MRFLKPPISAVTWSLKNEYLSPATGQNLIQIFSNLRVSSFLEKYDELFETVAFGKKLRYFTDQDGSK